MGTTRDMVSRCSPTCHRTRSVEHDGLELTEIHLPLASPVLGLNVCTTTALLKLRSFALELLLFPGIKWPDKEKVDLHADHQMSINTEQGTKSTRV